MGGRGLDIEEGVCVCGRGVVCFFCCTCFCSFRFVSRRVVVCFPLISFRLTDTNIYLLVNVVYKSCSSLYRCSYHNFEGEEESKNEQDLDASCLVTTQRPVSLALSWTQWPKTGKSEIKDA